MRPRSTPAGRPRSTERFAQDGSLRKLSTILDTGLFAHLVEPGQEGLGLEPDGDESQYRGLPCDMRLQLRLGDTVGAQRLLVLGGVTKSRGFELGEHLAGIRR